MRRGTFTRHLTWQDAEGRRTAVTQRRFVSMKDEHVAGLQTTFTAENWSGTLQVSSGLDGRVVNAGVKRYRDLNPRHLQVLGQAEVDQDTVDLQVQTLQSSVRVALAARTRLRRDDRVVEADRRLVEEPGFIAHELSFEVAEAHPATVEKIVALYTSRDRATSESRDEARLTVAAAEGFDGLPARHEGAWNSLWNRFDIGLDSANEWTETVLHLHIFHLLQTVSPHTLHLDVGVPARGWHGEAYRGHIFWDEMFFFPFLNFQRPILAGALLAYRHARLGAARAAARAAGYDGAMFPWQSGSNGREETQAVHLNPTSGRWLPDHSRNQRHVNIAIAYNVWQHYMVTGSTTFLRFTGAELLIEIARFWASIASYNSDLDRYEIRGVMGPDEYHEAYPDSTEPGLRNNTYTNVMAVWVLQRALEALDLLPAHYRRELVEELTIRDEELDRWRDMTRKMKVVFHPDGAMAGTVDIVLRCLTGMRARGPVLRFDPALPPEVKRLTFSVHYRAHRIDVTLGEDRMRLGSRPGAATPIKVLVHDQTIELAPGQQHEVSLQRRP
jgi:trehalose/maltose hydrolase-like predicted phosphorylase